MPLAALFAAFCLVVALMHPADAGAQQCRPAGGGPPCETGGGVASLADPDGSDLTVGNPFHPVTGNKYQEIVDAPALPGPLGLELRRHYNAGYVGSAGPTGRGWTLSYDTRLYRTGERLQIVQADGRRLVFRLPAAPEDGSRVGDCVAEGPGQGRLEIAPDGYRWTWPWGRELRFDRDGFLVRIAPVGGSDAEALRIRRDRDGRIVQVTDPAGRHLAFRYDAAGHLASVVHPLGRWHYRIDAAGRLQASHGPDGVTRHYRYDDPDHPWRFTAVSVAAPGDAPRDIGRWSFDDEGRVTWHRRSDGSEIRMAYRPAAESEALAAAAQAIVGAAADGPAPPRPTAVSVLTNALGDTTTYTAVEIAGRWRVIEIRGPGCADCGPTDLRMRYDERGQLVARWRIGGDGIEYRRDAHGRIVAAFSVSRFEGTSPVRRLLRRYEYADAGGGWPSVVARPSVVAGREHRIILRRDERGNLLEVTREGFSPGLSEADGSVVAGTGNPDSPVAIRRSVRFSYRTVGGRRLLVAIDGPLPNGPAGTPEDSDVIRFGHDGDGRLAIVMLPGGAVQRILRRDAGGRSLLVSTSDGHRLVQRRFVRDAAARLVRIEIEAWRLDAHGRPLAASRLQRRFAWRYDAAGRLQQAVDAAGRTVFLQHDAAGRLVGIRDATGHRSTVERDAEGRVQVVALYRPGSAAPARAAYFARDAKGRVRAVLLPDGRLLRFERDRTGRALGMTEAAGSLRLALPGIRQAGEASEARDDFGQVVLRLRRHHGHSLYRYDAAGQLVERMDSGIERRVYRHDAAGRLVTEEVHLPDGGNGGWRIAETIDRHYEGALLVRVAGPVQSTTLQRDALGRIEATEVRLAALPARVLRAARLRDPATGLVTAEVLADGRSLVVERSAAADGRLPRRIRLRGMLATRVAHRLSGWLPPALHRRINTWLPATTLVAEITVDPFDGLVGFTHGNGVRFGREHDPAGRIVRVKSRAATRDLVHWRYRYGIGRRIRAIEPVGPQAGPGPSGSRFAHDTVGGMPPGTSSEGLSHDAAGRVVADHGFRFEYGSGGRLAAVRDARDGSLLARYAYNELGQRVGKSVRGRDGEPWTTTHFLWSGSRLLAELDANGTVLRQHVALDDGGRSLPVALLDREAGVLAVHAEHRGVPVALTDRNGRIAWRARVAPSGAAQVLQSTPGVAMHLRLPGQYADAETGLHDNWHRSYDPRRGRYLQPDPLGYPGSDDPHAYAGGDPVNRADPLGLYEIDVHYYMTFFLGVSAGLHPEDARIVALAAQYVDDNPLTRPLDGTDIASAVGSVLRNRQQLLGYHFVLSGADGRTLAGWRNDRLDGPDSPQLRNLLAAADGEGVSRDGSLQFLGEYLHALADTFAHRDADDMPYDALLANCGIGHGFDLHEPDLTYDGMGGPGPHADDGDPPAGRFWRREARTLAMELRVHDVLLRYGDPTRARSFAEIEQVLREFNAIPERERGRGSADFPRKIARLEAALAALGYGALDLGAEAAYGYSEREAALNRRAFLRDERTGAALLEIDFPGTCLEGGTRCRSD